MGTENRDGDRKINLQRIFPRQKQVTSNTLKFVDGLDGTRDRTRGLPTSKGVVVKVQPEIHSSSGFEVVVDVQREVRCWRQPGQAGAGHHLG